MPARPRTIAPVAAALALGALLAACGSSGGTTSAGTTRADTTAPAAATVAPATPGPAATTPAATTPAAPTRTTPPAPVVTRSTAVPRATTRPVPFVADPWKRGYEFGFVWGARQKGNTVALTFDRAGMLLGAQAKAYYDAHPAEERSDFKILDDKSFTEILTVPASATLYGNQRLGARNGAQNQRIDLARLVARASGGDRSKVAVWVKRTGSGPVVYLAEQYLP